MRHDMKDVIIDVTRKGGSKTPKPHFNEDAPTKLPMRPKGKSADRKSQDDRLAPLERFLAKNCGRPWNDVYSEICAENDLHNVRGYHLRLHLEYLVEQNCARLGKKIVDGAGRPLYHPDFYVLNGILYRTKRERYRWKNQKITFTPYWKKDGIWYELSFVAFNPNAPFGHYDNFFMKSFRYAYQLPYGKAVVAIGKRQLNSREIKKLGLNDA